MKTLNKIITAIIAGTLVCSCDFLEKEPTQMTVNDYFKTQEEAYSFLTGVYATLSFYGTGNWLWMVGGDDLSHYGGSGRSPMTEVICNRVTTSNTSITNMWLNLYTGINRANIFLENIDRVEGMSEDLKAQYTAEARFLRAYYYFLLVQNWGDVPFHGTSTKEVVGLDIPQTDRQELYDFIISEMEAAATGGLVTAQSLNYLPGHVSMWAAYGILARVCLFRAGEHYRQNRAATEDEKTKWFEQADFYATLVKEHGGYGLAPLYGQVFVDLCSNSYNTTANESMWEVEFAGNGTEDIKVAGGIGNLIGLGGPDLSNESFTGKADPGFGYEYVFATPKLYDYYAENGDLERLYWNIKCFSYQREILDDGKQGGVTGRCFSNGTMDEYMSVYGDIGFSYGESEKESVGDYEYSKYSSYDKNPEKDKARACAKYRREFEPDKKSKGGTSINFPILRYSDVLLMIAETQNELHGPTDLAYECINEVRTRAGIDPLESGLSQDEFREKVKEERAMELCFEMTRRSDLIRWGDYVKNMRELVDRAVRNTDGEWKAGPTDVYTYFNITETLNHLPIPEIECSVNKKINQNPGW